MPGELDQSDGCPAVVPMERARKHILSLLDRASGGTDKGAVRVVAIAGPVASGKSTLAATLSSCVISTDDYLPDYDRTPEHLRDLPEHADLDRLAQDLAGLRAGRATHVPRWSFDSHSRVGERLVHPGPVVVVEGLHALHMQHAPAVDVRVFVEADAGLRRERWEARERAGERGWDIAYALEFFDRVAEPTFARFAEAYRASAHVVVVNQWRGDARSDSK